MKKKKQAKKTSSRKRSLQQKKSAVGPETTGIRLWLFRFAMIVIIPALMLIGIEMGLRVFGYGVPTGFIYQQKIDGEDRILSNPYFIWRFIPPRLAREAIHFSLPSIKEKGTYRIFVFGGSAAQGAPTPAFGMARMLEVMLRNHYPGVDFEVINAAITSINSHVVLPIARDCSKIESDLFVVYLGNNEVVGPYGAGTVFSPLASNLAVIRAGIALKATRLGQLMADIAFKVRSRDPNQPREWGGMEMFRNHQVRASDPNMKIVYHHFEKNLSDISRIAQKSGIPVILSTVGVNLKDCAPFASLHHPGLSDEDIQAWEQLMQKGEALQKQNRFVQAIQRFLQAEEIDADHAELHFRLAKCYWGIWDFKNAKARYVKARELDTLRFRADTRINEIIRDVAVESAGQGVYLADARQMLEENSPESATGDELFYEHVHLNFAGTYLVARAIFKQVQQALPDWISRQALDLPVLSEKDCAKKMVYTGWSRLMSARSILQMMHRPPFTDQLDNSDRIDKLQKEIDILDRRYTFSVDQQAVLKQYKSALNNNGADLILRYDYAEFLYKCLNNTREAEKQLKLVIEGRPQSAMAHYLLARMSASQGKQLDAEAHYRNALIYNPRWLQVLSAYTSLLLQQKKYEEAVPYLQQTVEIDPGNAMARSNLGVALTLSSDDARSHRKALAHLKKAVDIGPDLVMARRNLANYYSNKAKRLLNEGEKTAARKVLEEAVSMLPEAFEERYNLALLLEKEGNRKAAAEHASVILESNPDNENAQRLYRRLTTAGNR